MAKQPMRPKIKLSRRALLTGLASLGATSASAAFLAACQPVHPLDAARQYRTQPEAPGADEALAMPPTAPVSTGVAKVAFVKTRDRVWGVRRAVELLGPPDVGNKRVLLKPNFNSADPTPGSTHPDVLLSSWRVLTALLSMPSAWCCCAILAQRPLSARAQFLSKSRSRGRLNWDLA